VDHGHPDQGPAPDGVALLAVHLPNPQAVYTVLFSHGNAEDIRDVAPLLNEIHESGFGVFAYDYRGYGTGDGVPTEENAYKDIDAAYAYLTGTLGVAPARIIAYGRSLGGGPAVDLASRKPLTGLILESTFVTAFRVRTHIPILPFDKFRNQDRRRACPGPGDARHRRRNHPGLAWPRAVRTRARAQTRALGGPSRAQRCAAGDGHALRPDSAKVRGAASAIARDRVGCAPQSAALYLDSFGRRQYQRKYLVRSDERAV
jgi:pimeloyl-ACP methyl ester carboxylesterase